MYSRNRQICPCCGKTLYLIPPTEELLPDRFGLSKNGVEFYLISDPRYIPYTISPRSRSYFNSEILTQDIKIRSDSLMYQGNSSLFGRFDQRLYKLIAVPKARKMLEHNLLMYPAMDVAVFFCRNCKAKLALNFYPASVFDSYAFPGVLALSVLFVIERKTPAVTLSFFSLFLFFILAVVFSCVFAKMFMSNFVVTDQSDALITPEAELNISRKELKRIFLHRSNIYETELDGEGYRLYLTEKRKTDLKLHICGIDGEQKRMLALIREKQKRGETVILPLKFEGKLVGNAEVLETYNPPESSDKER